MAGSGGIADSEMTPTPETGNDALSTTRTADRILKSIYMYFILIVGIHGWQMSNLINRFGLIKASQVCALFS